MTQQECVLTWILLIFWSCKVGLYCGVEQGFGHVHHFTLTKMSWFIFSMSSVLKMTHLNSLAPLFAGHLLQISACTASPRLYLEEATYLWKQYSYIYTYTTCTSTVYSTVFAAFLNNKTFKTIFFFRLFSNVIFSSWMLINYPILILYEKLVFRKTTVWINK